MDIFQLVLHALFRLTSFVRNTTNWNWKKTPTKSLVESSRTARLFRLNQTIWPWFCSSFVRVSWELDLFKLAWVYSDDTIASSPLENPILLVNSIIISDWMPNWRLSQQLSSRSGCNTVRAWSETARTIFAINSEKRSRSCRVRFRPLERKDTWQSSVLLSSKRKCQKEWLWPLQRCASTWTRGFHVSEEVWNQSSIRRWKIKCSLDNRKSNKWSSRQTISEDIKYWLFSLGG